MKKNILLKIVPCILIPVFIVFGQVGYDKVYPDAGTKFFPFLKIGYEARSAGMAGVSIGIPNDIYGILSNPAAIGYLHSVQSMVSYRPVMLDVRGGALAFATPQLTKGVWAAHLIYLSGGVFDNLMDENGNPIEGSLHPYSIAASVCWALAINGSFSMGLTLKGIYERLSEGLSAQDGINRTSADGFAADIGMQYRKFSSRLVYGVVVQNIGFIRSSYSDNIEKTGLPISVAAGISYIFKNAPSVRLGLDLEKPGDDYLQYKVGTELNLYKQMVLFRGGYCFSQSDLNEFFNMIRNGSFDDEYQKSNWSLFTFGIGLKTNMKEALMTFDAACNIRVDRMDPGFVFTVLVDF